MMTTSQIGFMNQLSKYGTRLRRNMPGHNANNKFLCGCSSASSSICCISSGCSNCPEPNRHTLPQRGPKTREKTNVCSLPAPPAKATHLTGCQHLLNSESTFPGWLPVACRPINVGMDALSVEPKLKNWL